jgi:cell division septation protein DedD
VNEPSEATHYQIELTSRQVLTALVVLLVCLFASFFAGVWIGRNAEAEEAALEMARVDPVGRAGERFDFFSRTDAAPGSADGAADAPDDDAARLDDDSLRRDRPLEEADFGPDPDDQEIDPADIAAGDPEALFEDDPAAGADDGELSPPEEMGRGGRRRRAAARPGSEVADIGADDPIEAATEPTRAPPAPPPAEPTAEPAAAAASARSAVPGESGHFIQVLATADRAKAAALVDRLLDADFKAFLAPSEEGGRTVYRVRVGPFSDRALATRQAAELKTRWGLDSWIPPGAP